MLNMFKFLSHHEEHRLQTTIIWGVRHSIASSGQRQSDVPEGSRKQTSLGRSWLKRKKRRLRFQACICSFQLPPKAAPSAVRFRGGAASLRLRAGLGGPVLLTVPCVSQVRCHLCLWPVPGLEFLCTSVFPLFRWHFAQLCLTMSDALNPCSFTPRG